MLVAQEPLSLRGFQSFCVISNRCLLSLSVSHFNCTSGEICFLRSFAFAFKRILNEHTVFSTNCILSYFHIERVEFLRHLIRND